MHNRTKPWKTLGLTTQSRLWVTADQSKIFPNKPNNINNLSLTGQTLNPSHKSTKLSFWNGRTFSTLRLSFQCFLLWVLFKSLSITLLLLMTKSVLTLTTMQPETLFNFFSLCSLFFFFIWYNLTAKKNPYALLVGAVALIFTSLAITTFKTIAIIGVKFKPINMKKLRELSKLHTFARANKITFDQKYFVYTTYLSMLRLLELEASLDVLPRPNLLKSRRLGFVPPHHYPIAYFSTTHAHTVKRWPNLPADKFNLISGQGLVVFQWQNLSAESAELFRSKSLWHSHRLDTVTLNLVKLKLLKTGQRASTVSSLSTIDNDWLFQLNPITNVTTTLLNTTLAPVRYDIIQSLPVNQIPVWYTKSKRF